MSRDGSGVYSKPGGTTAVTGTPVSSSSYNTFCDDLVTDLNAARPISAGGTGATTASGARTALGVSATDATITAIAALDFSAAGSMMYSTAADTFSLVTSTAAGRALLDDADAAAQRTTLGFSTLTDYVTLTGSQTLTNKTLTSPAISSPTLSGTVAGAATWSGIQTLQQQVNIGSSVASGGVALHIANSTVTNNQMGAYFQGAGTAFAFVPYDSGSYSTSDEFGYDYNSNVWFFDSATVNLAGSPIVSRSSTDTLTNKTLSSPTLSGTVAGSPTLSGSYTFAGGHQRITQVSTGASPAASGSSLTDIILRVGASNVGSAGYGLDVGTSNATGQVWMQARDWTSYATNVAINLNPNGGGATLGGVAIPTISSTDTLTNKTLSSPTLSGTVAGSPTASGNWTFTASPVVRGATQSVISVHTAAAGLAYSFGRSIGSDDAQNFFLYDNIAVGSVFTVNSSRVMDFTVAPTSGGVAVPTISSTSTLTNKTLTSPTLSGTVAGTPTFSGDVTFTGTTSITISTTEPRLDFYETNAGSDAKRWSFINDGGAFGLQTRTDADVFSQTAISISRSGGTVGTIALSGTALTFGGVAIPTISSTDTLTNKTISSPTLSGTVAGSPTFSGTVAFGDANLNIQLSAGVGYLVYDSNDYIEYNRTANQFAMRVSNSAVFTVSASAIAGTPSITAMSATAIPAGGTAGAGIMVSSTANFGVFFGSGAPTLSAAQGSLYMRSDGSSTSTRMYVNTNGSTGWTAVTTAT